MKEDFIPDIDEQLKNPQFDRTVVTPTDPDSLMRKFQMQKEAEQQELLRQKEQLIIKATKRAQEMKITDSSDINHTETLETSYPQMAPQEQLISNKQGSLKDRIAAAESKLGIYDTISRSNKPEQARSYLDEYGDETFYVKNISNGHVVISDVIDMDKISRGSVIDLMKLADLETIKKSRDIRVALSGYGQEKLLKRLTPEEYAEEIEREARNKDKIEQFKVMSELKAATGEGKTQKPVRPVIEAKLEKLRLSYSDKPHLGISPVEFIQWVNTERLDVDELDYILGAVQDKDIRMFVHEKKKDLL
jgi:hypothetical protein